MHSAKDNLKMDKAMGLIFSRLMSLYPETYLAAHTIHVQGIILIPLCFSSFPAMQGVSHNTDPPWLCHAAFSVVTRFIADKFLKLFFAFSILQRASLQTKHNGQFSS